MPKLMLIDGNSLTYRAFFALPTDMATAGGQVTNAVFGFTSMLINLLRDHQPDHVAVARHEHRGGSRRGDRVHCAAHVGVHQVTLGKRPIAPEQDARAVDDGLGAAPGEGDKVRCVG